MTQEYRYMTIRAYLRSRLLSVAARVGVAAAVALTVGLFGRSLAAQQPAAAPTPGSARAIAPIDLTGNWVSVVTEDWRFRMVTPPKGDYASVPLNAAARTVADAWDPAKDTAAGNACKSYGAAAIMRVPGRLHISWQDDTTMKIETDAGTQTRLLHFTGTPGGDASWQGYSAAVWEFAGGFGGGGFGAPGGGGGGGGGAGRGAGAGAGGAGGAGRGGRGGAPPRGGSLKVVTTRLKEGYLRKNGVPYSDNTTVTEYFDRHTETNGDEWFTVTTIVDDGKYLAQSFITSTHFKKEADASKWFPTPCKAS
jgi:hypothetical protein